MRKFHNTMNVNNAEEIMNAIYDKIADKEYVFISVNNGYSWGNHVDSRLCQLNSEPHFWTEENGQYCGFNFSDGWVWGLSTAQHEDRYDHEFNSPYVVIDYSRIDITHRAPAGHLLHWQILILD